MRQTIEFVNLDVSRALALQIQEILDKIKIKFNWVISAQVFIRKENDKEGKGKVCEIKLNTSGSQIFASSNEYSFETAILKTKKELERQLKKRKELKLVN